MGQALSHLFGSVEHHEEVDPLAEDPGGDIPGVDTVGSSCSCSYPPVLKSTLHQADKDFWFNLDKYTAHTLLSKKPMGEREFAEGMHRFELAKDQISESLRQLRESYTDLAIARRDLEQSQQGAAWEHFSKCRPLSKKYGLYLPCHENFKAAMHRYRGLLQKPGCPVGASLPLRPAALPPALALAGAAPATPANERARSGSEFL
ncbi:unnamed protein product [Effrenium voratum]|uniref:Uncharacterized protein n=1 Tax=Effrenium voratum TaxID=2562239 RepID=A0AA36J8I4_9DINO|nr:unnamed protein product [Effrenium voratum]CAJ1437045.1 unnamed protein product [Effrenium voratum]